MLYKKSCNGFPEQTYHTFTYGPLADDSSTNLGMLCMVTEEPQRCIGERWLALLRELAVALVSASAESEVHQAVKAVLKSTGAICRLRCITFLPKPFSPDEMQAKLQMFTLSSSPA